MTAVDDTAVPAGRRCRARGVVAVVALVATACSGSSRPAPSLPARPHVVVLTMREYRFDYPRPVPAGRVVFQVRNAGRQVHRVALLRLPEDLPPFEAQLKGQERRVLAPFAGVPNRPPGGTGAFAVDLAPGVRYGLACFVIDKQRRSHAVLGMNSEFRAGRPEAGPTTSSVVASTKVGG